MNPYIIGGIVVGTVFATLFALWLYGVIASALYRRRSARVARILANHGVEGNYGLLADLI